MTIRDKLFAILDKWFGGPIREKPDFVRQLGNPIDKFSEASDVVKRITCGLSLCAKGDFERGHGLLLSEGAVAEMDYTPSGKHAYVYTELLSLGMQAVDQARKADKFGLFPMPIQLAWVRTHDLILGDLLVHLSRRVQPLSCAGIVAHYREEIRAGRAISEPMIQEAAEAYAIAFPVNT